MSGVVGFMSVLPVKLAVPFGFWVEAFWNRAPNSAFPLMVTACPLGPESELAGSMV